jgi:type I restriction enzyme M protein
MTEKIEIKREGNKIFAPLKNKFLIETPEETVRQNYIEKLVNHYGYSLDQMAQEKEVANSQRGQGRASADIVIWKSAEEKRKGKNAFIVVECKAENITVRKEDYFQGFNYATWAGASFFVTTNEKETKFFNVDKDYLPQKLQEITDIPKAKDVNNEKKIDKLLKSLKTFERDEFAKLLFACHNIIRNNDKFSPEMAFDEISKILFMKIKYERNPDEDAIFSLEQFKKNEKNYEKNIRPSLKGTPKDLPYMQFLFDRTKDEFKEDELFEPNEQIKIRQVSFEAIVEKLQIYNLSDTSDDVKGIAFEKFLGKTFRGELGQFFTPRTIVNYIVDILDPQEGETICDPTAGSGGFLIKAFEHIRSKIEADIQKSKEKIKEKYFDENFEKASEEEKNRITEKVNKLFHQLNEELRPSNEKGRLHKLSYYSIYGTDANPRMARTAKMNMIMHGDGHGGVHHNDGLLNINGIFENRFDVILTNPPFGSRVSENLLITENDKYTDKKKIKKYIERYTDDYIEALKQVNDNIGKPILDLYDLGKVSGLTEVLFMERCLRLLRPGGRIGIVLPEGVLNNAKQMVKVREYFEGRAKLINITSIPQDVFIASGATVKPSLVFLKKFTKEETAEYQRIKKEVTEEINKKYQPEIDDANKVVDNLSQTVKDKTDTIKKLKKDLKRKDTNKEQIQKQIDVENIKLSKLKDDLKIAKKDLKAKLKEIEQKKADEIKQGIKDKFNYEIPIAEVEYAGIDSKGASCENQLIPLAKEYTEYRIKHKLWETKNNKVTYEVQNDDFVRVNMVGEKEVFYSKELKG